MFPEQRSYRFRVGVYERFVCHAFQMQAFFSRKIRIWRPFEVNGEEVN